MNDTIYLFFANGEYMCDNDYFRNGERSCWKVDIEGQIRYSHHYWRPRLIDHTNIDEWGVWGKRSGLNRNEWEPGAQAIIAIIKEWADDKILLGEVDGL